MRRLRPDPKLVSRACGSTDAAPCCSAYLPGPGLSSPVMQALNYAHIVSSTDGLAPQLRWSAHTSEAMRKALAKAGSRHVWQTGSLFLADWFLVPAAYAWPGILFVCVIPSLPCCKRKKCPVLNAAVSQNLNASNSLCHAR